MVHVLRNGCLAILLLALTSSSAFAAKENVNTQTFKPHPNGVGLVTNESGDLLGHLQWTLGLIFNYAYKPVVVVDGVSGKEVRPLIFHRIAGDLGFAIGLFRWVEIGLNIPFTWSQDGFQINDNTRHIRKLWMLGDVSLSPKVAILKQEMHKVSLSLSLNVTFPTADPRTALGDSSYTFNPMLNLSYQNRWYAALNLGTTIRKAKDSLGVSFDHDFKINAGFGYTFKKPEITLFAEAFTSTPFKRFFRKKEESPLELYGGIRWAIKGFHLLAGAGTGLIRGVGSPRARVFLGLRYTTFTRDRDGDGIPDNEDQCPDDPEDKDGFEDHDGCPDPDNDKDGICDPWVKKKGLLGKYAHICKGSDKCPNDPEDKDGFEDEDGCPDPDNDKDGICDPWVAEKGLLKKYAHICKGSDKCPNDPEDKDGFEDEDGCPDPDNDKDGICDPWVAEKGLQAKYAHICKGSDKCPNDPEDKDGFEDEDGCPDPDNDKDGVCDPWVADKGLQKKYASICTGRDNCPNVAGPKENNGCPLVKLTATKIEILQKVFFKTASSKILEKSFPLLAKVAEVLKQNPDLKLVRVEGHTDTRGKRRYNIRLSQARAKSVMLHLIKKHGIEKKRLQAKGYGPDQPIDKGDNETAWAKNRRVEFTILKREK